MRIKLFVTFVMGFAAGMVALAATLWLSGSLAGSVAAAPPLAPPPMALAPTPAPAILPAPAKVPEPASALPPGTTPVSQAALGMPIAGIDPATLKDTFAEKREGHAHEAQDIMAPRGTPVVAVDEGNVVKLFTSKQGGLTVYQFNDARDLCYYYAHLDRYAPDLKEGTLLRRGDVLGYVGSTGNASPNAPHLHFAVFELGPEKEWWKGTAIDPLPMLQGTRH